MTDPDLPEPDAGSDRSLMSGLAAGDARCADVLCDRYSERLWRYAAVLIGSHSGAIADVVQETFLSLIRAAAQFDPQRGSLWGWLSRIAHNHAMDWHRHRKRQRAMLEPGWISNGRAAGLVQVLDDSADPLTLMELDECRSLVREILASLPEHYSLCLTLKYLDGCSAESIAEQTGENRETVRSRIARARHAFRDAFLARTTLDLDASATPTSLTVSTPAD